MSLYISLFIVQGSARPRDLLSPPTDTGIPPKKKKVLASAHKEKFTHSFGFVFSIVKCSHVPSNGLLVLSLFTIVEFCYAPTILLCKPLIQRD